MSTKRIAVLTSVCWLLVLSACNRGDMELAANSEDLRTRESPVEITVRELVQAEELAEERAEAEQHAVETAIKTDTRIAGASPALRRAEADLDTVNGAKLEAKASFEERPDGLVVLVKVEDAEPGTRSVRIYDRESCEDLEAKGLGEPLDTTIKHGNLGSVTIGPSGKGTLEVKAPTSTLKPDDRASLLGKAIVVQERSDGDSPKGAGDAIACGVIRLHAGLADKAGRMTEPAH